jgi:hypothetical protein
MEAAVCRCIPSWSVCARNDCAPDAAAIQRSHHAHVQECMDCGDCGHIPSHLVPPPPPVSWLYPSATPLVGLAVASCQGGSIMTTSKVATLDSLDQSKVVTFAWMGMQCGGTCHSEGSRSSALPTCWRMESTGDRYAKQETTAYG